MLAALYGRETCMTVLLKAGVPINAQNSGTTALHNAASGGNLGCISKLLDAGADTELRDSEDYTPLQKAAQKGQKNAAAVLREHDKARARCCQNNKI